MRHLSCISVAVITRSPSLKHFPEPRDQSLGTTLGLPEKEQVAVGGFRGWRAASQRRHSND